MMRSARPLAGLLVCWMLLAAACGGGDAASDGQATDATATVNESPEPALAMPVSRFALSLDDLPDGYLTDRDATFHLTAENYSAATKIFPSPDEGKEMLEGWGYIGGYETAFVPERRMTSVLNGGYYAAVEVHLFQDSGGSARAQDYFERRLAETADRVSTGSVGNASSAWKVTLDTVPGSSIAAVYHRVVFRRGNLLAVVQTYGSDVLMSVDVVRSLALRVDEKALGLLPAVEPTPLGQPETPTPTP